jgi:hypothetical protein
MNKGNSMDPSIKFSPLSAFQPVEQLYLKFVYNELNLKIINRVSPIFLKASEEENDKFITFVDRHYVQHAVTDPNYSIRKTLFCIWKIIKDDIAKSQNESQLKEEKLCQSEAHRATMHQDDMGKVLTLRQAKFFVLYAKNVNIPSKNSIEKTFPPLKDIEQLYLNILTQGQRLSEETNLVYVDASEKSQLAFTLCIEISKTKFTKKEDGLIKVINSLTKRAKFEVSQTIDPMYIEEEAKIQTYADEILLEQTDKGVVLTPRQVQALIKHVK